MTNYSIRRTTAAEVARLTELASADSGDAPCSRYGTRVAWFAPFAVAAFIAESYANGCDDEAAQLDDALSMVVNDSPAPAERIAEYWFVIPTVLRRELGGLRTVRALAAE